jgi:acetyl/propionyl-CoA carboxylase alpha subunit
MFEKVLIADHGEVVFRIARTCERLGVTAIAIFSETDTGAPHTTACDEAVSVGATVAAYSDVNALIAAAKQAGAAAIHPGYGPLTRDPAAARAIVEAGLILVAAPPDLTTRLSDALASRDIARLAGVRSLPLVRVERAEFVNLPVYAAEVGYPLTLRGEHGPAIDCNAEDDLDEALQRCLEDGVQPPPAVWLELQVQDPRVLGVQLIGDGFEQVALGDLERSIPWIAESPAPALAHVKGRGPSHKALCDAALRVAREAQLVGTGIAEFLLDSDGRTFFTGLRAGLPPEHALAEMCCNLDMVEMQLRIAAGERMPADGRRAQPTGHAAEARIEVVPHGPEATAAIETLRWPMVAPGCLRLETDLAVGHRPRTEIDPLMAKIAAYGQTRHQALLTLDRVLAEALILPLTTNLDFLRSILAHESFRAGQYDNGFAERVRAEGTPRASQSPL